MPNLNDIKNIIVDNQWIFFVWYNSLLQYLPLITLFGLTVMFIYVFNRLKHQDKIRSKPYTLGRLSTLFFIAIATAYIGVTVYDVIYLIYIDHSIPREDTLARLRFLLRPEYVAIGGFIKYFFIIVSPIILIMKTKNRDLLPSIYASLKIPTRKGLLLGAAYTASYIGIVFVVSYLVVQTGYDFTGRKEMWPITVASVTKNLYATSPFLAFLFPAVIIPMIAIGEEQLFRGILYTHIREMVGINFSLVVSAALFAVYHEISFFCFFYFLAGILLSHLYEKTGSLYPSIIVHATLLTISLFLGLIF